MVPPVLPTFVPLTVSGIALG